MGELEQAAKEGSNRPVFERTGIDEAAALDMRALLTSEPPLREVVERLVRLAPAAPSTSDPPAVQQPLPATSEAE